MSIKESRKKIQRSIVFLAREGEPSIAVRELMHVKATLDAQLAALDCPQVTDAKVLDTALAAAAE